MVKYKVIDEMRKDDKEIFTGTVEDLKNFIKKQVKDLKFENLISENEIELIEEVLKFDDFEKIIDKLEYNNFHLFGDCCKLQIEEK